MNPLKASIIIRTYNEEEHLPKLLSKIDQQEVDFEYEVIVVDSGSTDNTLQIATQFNTRIVTIKSQHFSFGRSLNYGVEAAQGEVCVCISAHCYPADKYWLQNICNPFNNPEVSLSYGRQIGGDTTKYSEHQIFAKWFPTQSDNDSPLPFCNNANSAIRKETWKNNKFDEHLTGLEDIDWAIKVKSIGKTISYSAHAVIYHIHDETYEQIYHRYYREALAYKKIYNVVSFSFASFLKYFTLNSISDLSRAIKDRVFWNSFFSILAFRFLQFWSTYKAHAYKAPVDKSMRQHLYYPRKTKSLGTSLKKILIGPKSSSQYIDITKKIDESISVWPGSIPFKMNQVKNIEKDGCNETNITINNHTGTHIDAPKHFIEGGIDVSAIPLHKLIMPVVVLEYGGNTPIPTRFFAKKAKHLKRCSGVIIKTLNSYHKSNGEFNANYHSLSHDAAEYLMEMDIDLIGTDGPSIEQYSSNNFEVHKTLLANNTVILENLALKDVNSGLYKLICLPLKIKGAEGAPARAILMKQ